MVAVSDAELAGCVREIRRRVCNNEFEMRGRIDGSRSLELTGGDGETADALRTGCCDEGWERSKKADSWLFGSVESVLIA